MKAVFPKYLSLTARAGFLLILMLSACQIQREPPATPNLAPVSATTGASATSTPAHTATLTAPVSLQGRMFRAGPNHTGVYEAPNFHGEWSFKAEGPIGGSPVILGNSLYFGTMQGVLYALDLITQQVKWQQAIEGGMFSSPAVLGDQVYAASLGGKLYALDAETGLIQWQLPVDGSVVSTPALENGILYLGTENGTIFAINAAAGKEEWRFPTGGLIQSSPVVDGGLVYIGCQNGFLYALDAANGEKRWMYLAEGGLIASPALANGTVFIGSSANREAFYAVHANTGKLVWRQGTTPVISSAAVVDGIVYYAGVDGSVSAVGMSDGRLLWSTPLGSPFISSPAVSGEMVYIGSTDGQVYAVERKTGQKRWAFQTNGEVWSSPAIAGESILVGSADGYLYALNAKGPQLALAPTATPRPLQPTPTQLPAPSEKVQLGTGGLPWWNDRIFYEVFVRSFADSNGDGTGDLQGLIAKLDYLNDGDPQTEQDLGVTGLWLMPVNESPSIHGYDAVDFRQVEKDYGTNGDFQQLVREAHKRGMAVIVDMVMNHTSNQNPWFIDASLPGSTHENWYIWSQEKPSYLSPWNSPVWHHPEVNLDNLRAYHALTDYYYGLFSPSQPDLNYRNGAVTQEMFDILRFWLQDLGADGFRLDAVRHLIEDGSVQSNTLETHTWLKNFYRFVHTVDPQALTVGEVWDDTSAVLPYVGDQVDIAFEFRLAEAIIKSLNQGENTFLAQQAQTVLNSYPEGQFATFLTNHDMARTMTQLGNNLAKAKAAAAILLTYPGVPFIYYGEEIGMAGPLPDINVRKPMQWDSSLTAGFTTGTPWIDLSPNRGTANVAKEIDDPQSLLSFYKQMIRFRTTHPALLNGDSWVVASNVPEVYSLLRQGDGENLLVVVNLSGKVVQDYRLALPSSTLTGRLMASLVWGEGQPNGLTANSQGGFDAYRPLAPLAPYGVNVIRLEP